MPSRFLKFGGDTTTPATPAPSGGAYTFTRSRFQLEMLENVGLPTDQYSAVISAIPESAPYPSDVASAGLLVSDLITPPTPAALDFVRATIFDSSAPATPASTEALILRGSETPADPTETNYVKQTIVTFPNAQASSTGWANQTAALGSTLTDGATLTATSASGASTTSATTTGTLTLNVPDISVGDLSLVSISCDLYWDCQHTGALLAGTGAAASASFEYSVNGTTWNVLRTQSGNVAATGAYWSERPYTPTFALPLVTNQATLNALQFRVVASVTSGTGAVTGASSTVISWFATRINAVWEKNY